LQHKRRLKKIADINTQTRSVEVKQQHRDGKVTKVSTNEGGMEVEEAKVDVHVVRESVKGGRGGERKYRESEERLRMGSWRREEQEESG